MNRNKMISLTNTISVISIILLIYWVFIFISITVFGFKIFKENITESFYLSIVGILALLSGSVIVNVMFNLTKISEVLSNEYKPIVVSTKKNQILILILSFPVIFVLLYLGDLRTSQVKENKLIESAKYMVENNNTRINELSKFKLDSIYFEKAETSLKLLSKELSSFPSVSVIIKSSFEDKDILIIIYSYNNFTNESNIIDFIYSCSKEDREYLLNVFAEQDDNYKFKSSNGYYKLYYPVLHMDQPMVLLCSYRSRYGKFGS